MVDLVRAQGRLREEDAVPLFEQILEAIQFLHHRLILHRDLKLR